MKKYLSVIAAGAALLCCALEVRVSNGTVSVAGDGMNFTVKDGVITSLPGLEFSKAPNQPAGLGFSGMSSCSVPDTCRGENRH